MQDRAPGAALPDCPTEELNDAARVAGVPDDGIGTGGDEFVVGADGEAESEVFSSSRVDCRRTRPPRMAITRPLSVEVLNASRS